MHCWDHLPLCHHPPPTFRDGVNYVDGDVDADFDECPFARQQDSSRLLWRIQGFECFDHYHLQTNWLWWMGQEMAGIRLHRIPPKLPWVLH